MTAFVLFIGIVWYTGAPGVMPDVIMQVTTTQAVCDKLKSTFMDAEDELHDPHDTTVETVCKLVLDPDASNRT